MNWNKVHIVFPGLLTILISACSSPTAENADIEQTYHRMDQVISVDSLNTLMTQGADITLLDIRKPKQYREGHLQGALNIWRNQITDASYPYGGMALPRDSMAALLGSMGVTGDQTLVFYDNKGGSDAARMWFLLKSYGHENMFILNGSFDACKAAGLPNDTVSTTVEAAVTYTFASPQKPEMFISIADVSEAIYDEHTVVLDTRGTDEYSGKRQKKGAAKAGRIPGSVLWDWGNAVHMEANGDFKSAKDLYFEMDSVLGLSREKRIIVYCHSGVRSSHTYFVLTELLGYPNVQNYDGSWTEWSHFDDMPFETDYSTPEITK